MAKAKPYSIQADTLTGQFVELFVKRKMQHDGLLGVQ